MKQYLLVAYDGDIVPDGADLCQRITAEFPGTEAICVRNSAERLDTDVYIATIHSTPQAKDRIENA